MTNQQLRRDLAVHVFLLFFIPSLDKNTSIACGGANFSGVKKQKNGEQRHVNNYTVRGRGSTCLEARANSHCLGSGKANFRLPAFVFCLLSQVDYYNATGGRWEPLIERVVAQGDREIVRQATKGSAAWGEVGAVPDGGGGGLEDDGEGEMSSVVRLSCFEEDVKVC